MAGVRDGSVAPATPPLEAPSNRRPREMVASFRASGRDRIRRTEGQDKRHPGSRMFFVFQKPKESDETDDAEEGGYSSESSVSSASSGIGYTQPL